LAGPVHGRYAYEALEFESSVINRTADADVTEIHDCTSAVLNSDRNGRINDIDIECRSPLRFRSYTKTGSQKARTN
jgi:hypothetical protein